MQQLALEALIVGVTLAAVLAIVNIVAPGALRGTASVTLVGFVVGAFLHLAFELSGLNAKYCTVGHACVN